VSGDYEASAEYAAMWPATGPDLYAEVPAALAGADLDLPLVDLGAGTGGGTIALADALPDATIMAVERSRAQRTVFMTRLSHRPDLHRRITVVPGDLFAAGLPPRWGGAVAVHLLCQLAAGPRARLLSLLADRLAPGAPAAVDIHADAVPAPVPRRLSGRFTLGRHEYERWFESEPHGAQATRTRNTYRVLAGDTVVDEQVVETTVPTLPGPALLDEVAAAELTAIRHSDRLLILRRP